MIPNGGFYWVTEMTFENHQQLVNLSKRPGYSVDYVEGEEGFFDVEGYLVDPSTVVLNKFSKEVEDYTRIKRTYRGKEKEVKKEHKDLEREKAIRQARSIGLKVSEEASTQFIKTAIGRAGKAVQTSLSNSIS